MRPLRVGDRFEYSADRGERALSRPLDAPADFDWTSAYGRALEGRELLRQRAYVEAESALDAALRADPHFVPALVDKALLRYRAGDDEGAWQTARRALAIDTYDAAANYYYGLASRALGRIADARDGFDVAAQSIEYRAAAFVQLAHLAIRAGRLRAAEEYAGTRMVEYVEWVTRHLRELALFMLLSLLLATLLLSSYPYPPQSLLRLILLVVLGGTVGSLIFVLVQMNRDEVLSRIDRTEPGRVTWNFSFVMNLLTFGALPLLTLLSSEFPELRSFLFAWADPILKMLAKQ